MAEQNASRKVGAARENAKPKPKPSTSKCSPPPYKPQFLGLKPLVDANRSKENEAHEHNEADMHTIEADAHDIDNILTAKLNQTREKVPKLEFWEAGIIAERQYKEKTKSATDYLVEALPVWRRAGIDGAPSDEYIGKWDTLKATGRTSQIADHKYESLVVHRNHPLFARHIDHEERLERGDASQEAKEFTNAERRQAEEMLGVLVKATSDPRTGLEPETMKTLEGLIARSGWVKTQHFETKEAIRLGQTFLSMSKLDNAKRRQLEEALLSKVSLWGDDPSPRALIIALLPAKIITAAWKVRPSVNANAKELFQETTTKFLTGYHDRYLPNDSFIHAMHIFYVLSALLQPHDATEDAEAATGDGGDNGDNDDPDADDAHDDDVEEFDPRSKKRKRNNDSKNEGKGKGKANAKESSDGKGKGKGKAKARDNSTVKKMTEEEKFKEAEEEGRELAEQSKLRVIAQGMKRAAAPEETDTQARKKVKGTSLKESS